MTTRSAEEEAPPRHRSSDSRVWIAIGVGVLIVACIVLRFATRSDLWLDEALSVNIARVPLRDLPDALRRDGAPPFYYLLLHFWVKVFGDGDLAVRSLSGIFAVATLPAMYFAGRRVGGRTLAWTALLVLAVSPYAIRYATEARMYALVMFLVAWGYVAYVRALERPTLGRLALITLITAALVYSHNWSWYLMLVVGALTLALAFVAVDPPRRTAAWRIAVAIVVGALLYLPWLPVFRDQLAKTGTPWGESRLPWSGLMDTFDGLGGVTGIIHGEQLLLRSVIMVLILLGIFAIGIDARRIEVDLETRPIVRWEAFVAFATLMLGLTLSSIAGTAFVTRYAAVVVPLLLLVTAVGMGAFRGTVSRAIVFAVVIVFGLAGGYRNWDDNRTQAHEVAGIIDAQAQPGDVVLYCPDQVGPSVHRLLARTGTASRVREMTFPDLARPEFVNWIDYRERNQGADANVVAQRVVDRAQGRTIWYVISPGYHSVEDKCEDLEGALRARRGGAQTLATIDDNTFEVMGLTEFPRS